MNTDTATTLPAATVSATHDTPFGTLTLTASSTGITRCAFARSSRALTAADRPTEPARPPDPAAARLFATATDELDRYFAGELREFTVPVDLGSISPFDHSVLTGLGAIGYGRTTSYGRLARQLGLTPAAARDVGQTLGRNPVLVLVPCHRVIGADGSLTGYAAGPRIKRRLLDLESATSTPRLELVW